MHITAEKIRLSGGTKEQVAAYAKRFPRGSDLSYETLKGTGWRVEWLAVLIEWPRRASVYADIDATWDEFDTATWEAFEAWESAQLRFQSLAPPPRDRMSKEAWLPYKADKEAAEEAYAASIAVQFDKMHDKQAKIIASALTSAQPCASIA